MATFLDDQGRRWTIDLSRRGLEETALNLLAMATDSLEEIGRIAKFPGRLATTLMSTAYRVVVGTGGRLDPTIELLPILMADRPTAARAADALLEAIAELAGPDDAVHRGLEAARAFAGLESRSSASPVA